MGSRALINTAHTAIKRSRAIHTSISLKFAEEAAASEPEQAKLSFAVPYKSIYSKEPIHTVVLPGLVGEYGVTGTHLAVMSELKPGLVQIYKTEGGSPEQYFVSGGFAVTHEDATTDVSVAEAVPLEDLDGTIAQQKYAEYKQKADSSPENSMEKAEYQIAADTYESICLALGVSI